MALPASSASVLLSLFSRPVSIKKSSKSSMIPILFEIFPKRIYYQLMILKVWEAGYTDGSHYSCVLNVQRKASATACILILGHSFVFG